MTRDRQDILFDKLLGYIFQLSDEDYPIYANTLSTVGFTNREIEEELAENCCVPDNEIKDILSALND